MPGAEGRFTHHLTVGPSAIDANWHSNNVEFVSWMQDAGNGTFGRS
jgi:hypothetical protein